MDATEKYKISEDGTIYSLNEDGSISQMGKIVDGKLSAIDDNIDANRQNSKIMESPTDLDAIFQSFGDIFGGGIDSSLSNAPSNSDSDKKEDSFINKEELHRLETRLSKLKMSALGSEYFDNVLLHLIDGFTWGKTSHKDIKNCIYKDSTYYSYLNNSRTICLYQNKNYKAFNTLSIDDLTHMPEQLIASLFFDEGYSLNHWLTLIEYMGLSVKFNSRKVREIQTIFGKVASELNDSLCILVFESKLFCVTLNLRKGTDDALGIVKSIRIAYKFSPEKTFFEKLL